MLDLLKNQKGFTMMELMVAMTIIVFGLLGLSSLVIQNLQAQSVNKEYLIASMLAQEGLELVRNQRDNNWLRGADWLLGENGAGSDTDILRDKSYNIDYRGLADAVNTPDAIDVSTNNNRLYQNANGNYTIDNSGTTATNFHRLIRIIGDQGDSLINASSTVMWENRGNIRTYQADTIFYDWR